MRRHESGIGRGACGRGSQPHTRSVPGLRLGPARPPRQEWLTGAGLPRSKVRPGVELPLRLSAERRRTFLEKLRT